MSSNHTKIPIAIKELIIKLHNEGKSYLEIAKNVSRPKSSVQYVIQNYKKTSSLLIAPGRGRRKIIDARLGRMIDRMVKLEPKTSAVEIAKTVKEYENVTLSAQTVRNFLHCNQYKACVPRKKPFISKKNVKQRLDYAKKYVQKPDEFWKTVIFTDESKFNIFGSDGRRFVWRKENTALQLKHIKATVKHGGGSVMVWGAMAAGGVGNLVFVETTMDKFSYLNILKENLRASATNLGISDDYRFLHDNDPKHTSMVVREWLLYNVKQVVPHPPQSPDLNPIEHLWGILEKKIRQHKITNKQMLKDIIVQEWRNISTEITEKLALSMKNRLRAVIAAKGYHTKY